MVHCPTREELSAYLLDDLPAADNQAIDQHVADCAHCETVMAELCEELALGAAPTRDDAVATHLAFGLLALHNGLISRDEMIQATGAWLQDRSSKLEDILIRENKLAEDDCAMLRQLLAKRVDRNPDPLTNLASLQSVRHELRKFNDPDLNASLDLLPGGTFFSDASGVPSHLDANEADRFKELYSHAKGGLGEIFVAHDQQLDRNVALKRMQSQHSFSHLSRVRFELEAEVTGKLEHPGIVPVYGKGSDEDGRPFYAMRLIRGNTLKEEIHDFHKNYGGNWSTRAARLKLQSLLRRLIDICNAIEYAHHRGVLHRDLKPANIMLGKFGETIVVDWGLAKTSDPLPATVPSSAEEEEPVVQLSSGTTSGPTTLGTVVGTLGYMSPEQASGNPDDIGTASDIYSLGAILYRLLTGKSSQESHPDKMEILRRIETGQVRPPRQLNPDVPRPLESICLKAMSLAPSQRYGTAREMTEDIESWIADERVLAHRETLAERVSRLVRRYKGWVAAAVGILLLAAVATVAALAVRDAKRSDQHAAMNHRKVRDVIDVWLTGAAEEFLRDHPEATGVRRDFLRRAIGEFNSLHSQINSANSDSPTPALELELEQALTRMRTGDLELELGEVSQARSNYELALRQFERHQNTLDGRLYHAECLMKLGGIALDQNQNQNEDAGRYYSQAKNTYESLVQQDDSQPFTHDALGACLTQIGMRHLQNGKLKEAEVHLRRAVDELSVALSLSGADPNTSGDDRDFYLEGLCLAERLLGDSLLRQPTVVDTAEPFLNAALQKSLELKSQTPDQRNLIELHADTLSFYANMLRKQERYEAEAEQRRRILTEYEALLQQYPWVLRYQESVGRERLNLAQALLLQEQLQQAESEVTVAKELLQELASRDTPLPRYRIQYASSLDVEAQTLSKLGNQTAALNSCKDAAMLFRSLTQQDETNDTKQRRANNLRTWGEILLRLDQRELAREKITESMSVLDTLDETDEYGQYKKDLDKTSQVYALLNVAGAP